MIKKIIALVILFTFLLTGCQKENIPLETTDEIAQKEEQLSEKEEHTFQISDLLIDGHELLGKCPYWNTNWEVLKEKSSVIHDTYFDSFPGTPDMQLAYSESEGITYVTDDKFIFAIILTDNTYGIHAGIKVGDSMTQTLIEEYHLQYFGKNAVDRNATIITGSERKSSQKMEYDSVFSGTTFISQEESDFLMREFLNNSNEEEQLFQSNEAGIAVSFYVREGIIVGICIEHIV